MRKCFLPALLSSLLVLSACQGEKGEKGDKGDPGAAGPAGPQGPAGEPATALTIVRGSGMVRCPVGAEVVSFLCYNTTNNGTARPGVVQRLDDGAFVGVCGEGLPTVGAVITCQ